MQVILKVSMLGALAMRCAKLTNRASERRAMPAAKTCMIESSASAWARAWDAEYDVVYPSNCSSAAQHGEDPL